MIVPIDAKILICILLV